MVRGVLYAALVALALWWAATGELLNGFDAALWLLCFFAIEGNILQARARGAHLGTSAGLLNRGVGRAWARRQCARRGAGHGSR